MIRHASALMLAAGLLVGPAAIVTAPMALAAEPTAAQLPPGTEIYSADGKPVGKVVDTLVGGVSGKLFVVAQATFAGSNGRMVVVPAWHFDFENGKVMSHMTDRMIMSMARFEYNEPAGGH